MPRKAATAPPAQSDRTSQREIMARKRAAERGIFIPELTPEARVRREMLRKNIYAALAWYFPEKFTGIWTEDRRAIVEVILAAAKDGGDQAIAAPVGEGKTALAEGVITLCVLWGVLKFPLLCSATGPDSKRTLSNIKYELETNDRLFEDFPEAIAPIRALEGAAQRANMQTVDGVRTLIRWADDHIIFPKIKGSACSGSILACRGLDAAIRGIRYRNTRPDLALIDDAETRESANSKDQIKSRETIIEGDIGGRGGAGKKFARVMLCTIMKKGCLSERYTDRKQKPSWKGRRYRLLVSLPTREDLWEEYMLRRQIGMETLSDPEGRGATQYYLERRAEMDAGAVVSNPGRFVQDLRDDGTPIEVSALQACYNIIADRGWAAFATEYQNDPPDEDAPKESGITANMVRSRLSGVDHGRLPDGTVALTASIDISKYACHYVVIAWLPGSIGYVIDYGVREVNNADSIGAEPAILNTLRTWRDELMAEPYRYQSNEPRAIDLILIDSGKYDSTIHQFCHEAGRPFRASKGFGSGYGRSPFNAPASNTKRKQAGDHWYVTRLAAGQPLYCIDVDNWKRWVHDRFITQPIDEFGARRPGSLVLFGNEEKPHFAYSKHQVAEIETEEFVAGRGFKKIWKRVSPNNHYFDATVYACAASAMLGIRMNRPATKPDPVATSKALTATASPTRRTWSNPRRGWTGGR